MKNFLRGLRWTWPYRGRLVLSIVCALCGAALFGANLSIIYPTFRLLENKDRKWADQIGDGIAELRAHNYDLMRARFLWGWYEGEFDDLVLFQERRGVDPVERMWAFYLTSDDFFREIAKDFG